MPFKQSDSLTHQPHTHTHQPIYFIFSVLGGFGKILDVVQQSHRYYMFPSPFTHTESYLFFSSRHGSQKSVQTRFFSTIYGTFF
jgi:hypothetical protein